jgi:hypothetical protein
MTAASPSIDAAQPGEAMARPSWIGRAFGATWRALFGVLFCLNPLTSVAVLGWLMRTMRRDTAIALVKRSVGLRRRAVLVRLSANPRLAGLAKPPNWFSSAPQGDGSRLQRMFGGLRKNVELGVSTIASLCVAVVPFGLLLLLGWWAGWDNSFNKGYEQAWVGPLIAWIGIFLALISLSYLPMGLAHQASEGRLRAFFEIKQVRALVAYAGWRYVGLALLYLVCALPIFALRGMPVFIENIYPGFAELDAEGLVQFENRYRLLAAIYVFAAVVFLRKRAARVYAGAMLWALAAGESWAKGTFASRLLSDLGVAPKTAPVRMPGRFKRFLLGATRVMLWFGLIVLIVVGQFLNHSWVFWVSYPLIALPWLP